MLNISRKYRSFLWEHPAYRKHPTGWVLPSLSYGQPSPETMTTFLFWIKEQLKKVSTSFQSDHVCPLPACSPAWVPSFPPLSELGCRVCLWKEAVNRRDRHSAEGW